MALTILPSIDLRNGKVVRLKQGDYGQQINYDVDPVDVAKGFAAAGAKWMHVVDLDGAKEGRPMQTDLIAKVAEASGLNVEVGGGIRSTADVTALLDQGIARVVVGTAAMEQWDWFSELVRTLPGKVVLALDAKAGQVATRGWTHASGKMAVDVAKEVSDWPLAAILYTDVAKDGMLTGPNFDETERLALSGKVPVIASGGVGSIDHVLRLTKLPVWGAIIGRSLYEGKVDLAEAIRIAGPQG
jgi:phosphoribosylformimino-5-aminoimidazole carboxamide ribotide isomerase